METRDQRTQTRVWGDEIRAAQHRSSDNQSTSYNTNPCVEIPISQIVYNQAALLRVLTPDRKSASKPKRLGLRGGELVPRTYRGDLTHVSVCANALHAAPVRHSKGITPEDDSYELVELTTLPDVTRRMFQVVYAAAGQKHFLPDVERADTYEQPLGVPAPRQLDPDDLHHLSRLGELSGSIRTFLDNAARVPPHAQQGVHPPVDKKLDRLRRIASLLLEPDVDELIVPKKVLYPPGHRPTPKPTSGMTATPAAGAVGMFHIPLSNRVRQEVPVKVYDMPMDLRSPVAPCSPLRPEDGINALRSVDAAAQTPEKTIHELKALYPGMPQQLKQHVWDCIRRALDPSYPDALPESPPSRLKAPNHVSASLLKYSSDLHDQLRFVVFSWNQYLNAQRNKDI